LPADLLQRRAPVVHDRDRVVLALKVPADQLSLLLVVLGQHHMRTHDTDDKRKSACGPRC
jgi:hypothetical protein